MNRFREEMRVIPRGAWVIAVLSYLAFVTLAFYVFIPNDPNFIWWPGWALPLFAAIIPLFFGVYVLLGGYVYGDARRRHAARYVDAAGHAHPQCDRFHLVLHPTRASVARLPGLRNHGGPGVRVLFEVR